MLKGCTSKDVLWLKGTLHLLLHIILTTRWKYLNLPNYELLGVKAPLEPASSEGLYVCLYVTLYLPSTHLDFIAYTK